MSNASFKAFLAKVQQDESLRNELRTAGGKDGMPVDAVVAFAARKGYDFKVEEVSGELSDQQLESVAGGVTLGTSSLFNPTGGLPSPYLKIDGLTTYQSAGTLMFKF